MISLNSLVNIFFNFVITTLNMRFTLLNVYVHNIVNYRHSVVQPISKTYSYCIIENLYLLNSNSLFPPFPAHGNNTLYSTLIQNLLSGIENAHPLTQNIFLIFCKVSIFFNIVTEILMTNLFWVEFSPFVYSSWLLLVYKKTIDLSVYF